MPKPTPYDRELAVLAAAVAHPVRVQVLRHLAVRGPTSVGDLVRTVGLAQATVSQHLAALRRAGLVDGVRVGRQTRYHVVSTAVRRLTTLAAGLSTSLPRP